MYYFLFVLQRWPTNLLVTPSSVATSNGVVATSTVLANAALWNLLSVATDGSRPRITFSCENFSMIDVNLSSDPFAKGHEKGVWIGNVTLKSTTSSSSIFTMRVAVKRPYKILEQQTTNEVLRRFRTERDVMNRLQHDGVVAQLGGCYSSLEKLVSVVEYVTPFKRLTDDYLAQHPKRAIALYTQLLELLNYLGERASDTTTI